MFGGPWENTFLAAFPDGGRCESWEADRINIPKGKGKEERNKCAEVDDFS